MSEDVGIAAAAANIKAKLLDIIDGTRNVLKGEPVIVIGNGAGVVIYLVAKAVGSIPDVDFATAFGQATTAIVSINAVLLVIRNYVSPVNG